MVFDAAAVAVVITATGTGANDRDLIKINTVHQEQHTHAPSILVYYKRAEI